MYGCAFGDSSGIVFNALEPSTAASTSSAAAHGAAMAHAANAAQIRAAAIMFPALPVFISTISISKSHDQHQFPLLE
jgi:hypothetical protein